MAIHGQVGRAPARRQSIRGAFPSVTSHFAVGALATFPRRHQPARARLPRPERGKVTGSSQAITYARLPERVSAHAVPSEDILRRESIWPRLCSPRPESVCAISAAGALSCQRPVLAV